jgi:hypothetical protein
VLVCGGRDFDDADFIHSELDRLQAVHVFTTLIKGDARARGISPLCSNGRKLAK